MSKPHNYYWSDDMKRTILEMKELSLKTGNDNFGCNHPPLLNVPLKNIVPDELHLMLRVTGIYVMCITFSVTISITHRLYLYTRKRGVRCRQ